IGADPAKLSLVERVDNPDSSKTANYEQRPFRYPIRGNYGKLQIVFANNRRVLSLSSSCIPDAERMQTALAAITPKLSSDDAIKVVRENEITYSDTKGMNLNFRVPASAEVTPRELVTFISPSATSDALEFHLAWETEVA